MQFLSSHALCSVNVVVMAPDIYVVMWKIVYCCMEQACLVQPFFHDRWCADAMIICAMLLSAYISQKMYHCFFSYVNYIMISILSRPGIQGVS